MTGRLPFARLADDVAARLRAAGLHTVRSDYAAWWWEDRPLNRSYVVVTDDEGGKVEWQAHEAAPDGIIGSVDSPLRRKVEALLS